MIISNEIGSVISDRAYSVTEQFQVLQTFIEALNFSDMNRYKTDKTANIVKKGII